MDLPWLVGMLCLFGLPGVWLGFLLGRWTAETSRGLHDARSKWDSRTRYRE